MEQLLTVYFTAPNKSDVQATASFENARGDKEKGHWLNIVVPVCRVPHGFSRWDL